MTRVKGSTGLTDSVPAIGASGKARYERKWPISYRSIESVTVLADVVMIFGASFFAGAVYHIAVFGTFGDPMQYLGSATLVAALFVAFAISREIYKPAKLLALRAQVWTVCLIWTSVFLLLTGTVFALKLGNEFSRGAMVLFAGFGLGTLIAHRILWRSFLTNGVAQRKFSGRNAVLITDHVPTAEPGLLRVLARHGFRLERHFALPPHYAGAQKRQEAMARAIAYIRGSDVQEIMVGSGLDQWPELRRLVTDLRILPLPVTLIPVGPLSEILNRPSYEIGNTTCIELQRGPLTSFERVVKRISDVVFAIVALLLFLPLILITAAAIKIDSPGPVLFRQRRCGFNGKLFEILKFRTMTVMEDGDAIPQAARSDSRVTPLGRWLRRTSIDELPQLLNVLNGTMSLVGPRPHALAHDTQFNQIVTNYAFRHHVKPGLTGWAQVNGCRGATQTVADIERRVELDLWYIDNWSLKLDIVIIFRTVFEVLQGRNAY